MGWSAKGKHGEDECGLGGRDSKKHKGGIAEMEFALDAAKRGYGVSKPYVDNERYDVIVDAARRLWERSALPAAADS